MTAEVVDGRRARGDRARLALVEATLRVIERDGIAAVTHRNVTREAALPASSAAYHFASINDLLEQALLSADSQAAEALDVCRRDDQPISAFSRWVAQDYTEQRSRLIAEYELFLYAARTPALRTSALRWLDDLSNLVSTWTSDQQAISTICAYVDGLLLQALVRDTSPDPSAVEITIRRLL